MMIVNNNNFKEEVLEAKGPVLVDFFADWCMPCKMFGPILESAAEDFEGKLKIVKVNIDESPELADNYHIMSIPTLKLFNGDPEPKATFVGVLSGEELEEWLASYGIE